MYQQVEPIEIYINVKQNKTENRRKQQQQNSKQNPYLHTHCEW